MTTPPAERLPDLAVLFPVGAWLRHPALRAWTTWLFVALVAVPPAALAVFRDDSELLGLSITLAAYFAVVWFLVLRVVVRPQRVGGWLLAQVVAAEIVLVLVYLFGVDPEVENTGNLLADVSLVGIPEELLKVLPVMGVAMVYRRLALAPRDMLFLAATSGLVFGAIEAVAYAIVLNDYSGAGMLLVLRFATDSISHALWAGVAGYFVGLAAHYRAVGPWLALAGLGLGIPALLHGMNDWEPVNSSMLWIVVQVVSALLFLGYARIGLVAAPPAPRPAPPAVIPTARTSGRHAADEDPLTAPILLASAR